MVWSNWLSMAVCTLQQILGVLHLHGYLRMTLYLWWDGSRCCLSSPYPAVYIMANPFLHAASLSHFSPTVFEPNVSTVDAKIHQTYLFMDKPLVTRSSTHARHLRQGKNGWLSLHSSQYIFCRYTTQPLTAGSQVTPPLPYQPWKTKQKLSNERFCTGKWDSLDLLCKYNILYSVHAYPMVALC